MARDESFNVPGNSAVVAAVSAYGASMPAATDGKSFGVLLLKLSRPAEVPASSPQNAAQLLPDRKIAQAVAIPKFML